MAFLLLCLFLLVPAEQPAPFRFLTDDVWLSQHQFLYALGLHEAQAPTRTRRALAGAPAEVSARIDLLSASEQQQWAAAVAYYAKGPSTRDAVFDKGLVDGTAILTAQRDHETLAAVPDGALDPEWRMHLERTAPIYRRVWWPVHRQANLARRDAMIPLIARHAPVVLPVIERAFGRAWPVAGFPVHLSSYASWAGAYSTGDNLLVVSSQDAGNAGMHGLETLFHEAMHQWDRETSAALEAAAAAAGTRVPSGMSHALIFYTAGAAVRRADPAHVPYAEVNGLWPRLATAEVKAALESAWQPFLDGRGTRDQALLDVMRRLK